MIYIRTDFSGTRLGQITFSLTERRIQVKRWAVNASGWMKNHEIHASVPLVLLLIHGCYVPKKGIKAISWWFVCMRECDITSVSRLRRHKFLTERLRYTQARIKARKL